MAIWNAPTTEIDPEALASTDMLYLAYTMARIRPVVPDVFVLQRLKDVQRIKGLTMETVILQFWLAGLTGLAESNSSSQRLLWKCLVLVKIPSIVSKLGYGYEELCDTVESTLRQLSFYRGILNECDDCVAEDGTGERADVLKSIAIGCQAKGLVRLDQLDILADVPPTHYDPEQYKFGKYSEQSPADAVNDLCGRTLSDFEHQEALLDRIIQVCEEAAANNDVLTLSKLCQTLDDNPLVVDLILLMRPPSSLLVPLESFVNNLQQNEDDDIDTCNSNLEGFGDVLILIMTIIRRYELAECLDSVLKDKQGFCYLWLHHTSATIPTASMSSMTTDMQGLMGRWISALFDSMGISDDLIQTSKPQMLLEISPSIFEQSLAACQAGVIDATTLNSGLDYFLQPCLLFVLIGVVQYLCQEIVFSAPSPLNSTHHSAHGASSASSMMSPTGTSPLASRGSASGSSGGKAGHTVTSGKSVAMMQSSLKSLLAGEAFPARLIRLLKSEISAALGHHAIENDHQLAIIHERLAETSVNYDSWKISEAYDVPKLAQQTVFAYDAIISGGRTPLVMKREKGWPVFGGSSYHLDVDLFRATLCYVGPAQFVTNILKRFLKAALTPNGRRAAELGAAMMTTPLVGCGDKHLSPQSLLWTLLCQTLWIPVPSRLETFTQGKHLATFVGMTLDMFQSSTFVQHRQEQLQQQQQEKGVDGTTATAAGEAASMEVDSSQTTTVAAAAAAAVGVSALEQLERDAAVEPFRVMLEQRLKVLEPIARDKPGFEGFIQGMAQYRERHPPLSLPLQGTSSTATTASSLRKVRMG